MAAVYTDANFDAEVIKAEKLTVVDFWAPWCGPCLALGPTIEALAKEYDGKVNIVKVNVDENPQLSINYGITKKIPRKSAGFSFYIRYFFFGGLNMFPCIDHAKSSFNALP